MGIRYRDRGAGDDAWIEVPDGETFDLGFAPNFNVPIDYAVLIIATNAEGQQNYCITRVTGSGSPSIQEYPANLLRFAVDESVLEGLEVLGQQDELPLGSNWGTSEGFAIDIGREVGDPIIEAELGRIRNDPTRSLAILQLGEDIARITTRYAQEVSQLRQFAAVRSFSANLSSAIYSRLPLYPTAPQIVENFTRYRSDRTLQIFDAAGNLLVNLQREFPTWDVEFLPITECPPDTCPVNCGDHICCYGRDGIAVASFPVGG